MKRGRVVETLGKLVSWEGRNSGTENKGTRARADANQKSAASAEKREIFGAGTSGTLQKDRLYREIGGGAECECCLPSPEEGDTVKAENEKKGHNTTQRSMETRKKIKKGFLIFDLRKKENSSGRNGVGRYD